MLWEGGGGQNHGPSWCGQFPHSGCCLVCLIFVQLEKASMTPGLRAVADKMYTLDELEVRALCESNQPPQAAAAHV